jgi:hypothetical protein
VSSRVLSILLLCAYVPLYRSEGPGAVVVILCGCVLPLACVWFPEPLADITRGFVTPSPPFLVWILGWITLLMPLMLKLVVLYTFR